MKLNILLLDNFDSFTYNLVDLLRSLGHSVTIYRNNIAAELIFEKLTEMQNAILVLSPGPGNPINAGSMPQLIKLSTGKIPILGICLGHQALILHYGGKIIQAKEIIHGKTSILTHFNHPIFNNLSNPLIVGRYHSLVGDKTEKTKLKVIATAEEQIMAICHEQDKVCGFQFHPESILTLDGAKLLKQTLSWLTS